MKAVSVHGLRAAACPDEGQSLVELALLLPLLLLILLGLADFGRAFYYTTIISNAAREGAAYLSQNPSVAGFAETNTRSVKTKVCNETGLFAYNSPSTCALTVTRCDPTVTPPTPPCPASFSTYVAGQDAVVVVSYDFRPISSYLVSRLIETDPMPLRAQATYPGLQ